MYMHITYCSIVLLKGQFVFIETAAESKLRRHLLCFEMLQDSKQNFKLILNRKNE